MNGVILPPVADSENFKFISIDNANRVAVFFGLEGFFPLKSIREKAKLYCSLKWDDAKAKYSKTAFGQEVQEFRMRRYCFESAYILLLFSGAYGFNESDLIVGFSDYIDLDKTSWTLGAMAFQLYDRCSQQSPS